MTIRWTDEALAELTAILDYLEATAPDVARGLATRVIAAERNIDAFPRAATYDPATNTYDRYIPYTRVILTYAIQDNFTEIIRVWHTSRDPATKPPRSTS